MEKMVKASTYFGLLAEFGAAEIPLVECSEKYFSLSPRKAKRAALLQQLPLPVWRLGTRRSPWMVSAADLAELIDAHRAAAWEEFRRLHS